MVGYDHRTLKDVMTESFGSNITYIEKPTAQQLADADVVLCITGTYDAEGTERPFELEKKDEALVNLAVNNNSNTIVIVHSGSAINMSKWAKKCAALLYGWYPGQNGAEAICDILTGKISPSGKLPMTIERRFKDSPAVNTVPKGFDLAKAKGNPNEKAFHPWTYDVHYTEGVLVGYRWYETKGIKPLYPFGYGLSYTTFELKNPKVDAKGKTLSDDNVLRVTIDVENVGSRDGAEVVQLYVSEKNPTVLRPVKELKAFEKVAVKSGKKQRVTFEVNKRMLAFWNDQTDRWQTNPGEYTLRIGTSSTDISAELDILVK